MGTPRIIAYQMAEKKKAQTCLLAHLTDETTNGERSTPHFNHGNQSLQGMFSFILKLQ
jgi:hypothetical protein